MESRTQKGAQRFKSYMFVQSQQLTEGKQRSKLANCHWDSSTIMHAVPLKQYRQAKMLLWMTHMST